MMKGCAALVSAAMMTTAVHADSVGSIPVEWALGADIGESSTLINGLNSVIFLDAPTVLTVETDVIEGLELAASCEWSFKVDGEEVAGDTIELFDNISYTSCYGLFESFDVVTEESREYLFTYDLIMFDVNGQLINFTYFDEDDKVVYRGIQNETSVSVEFSIRSISAGATFIPLIVVIAIAITTGIVEFALFTGVVVGSMMFVGDFTSGFLTSLDTYIVESAMDGGHVFVILFTLFLAGVVGMMEKSGGMSGLARAFTGRITSPRGVQLVGVACGILVFFDDYANCLVVGQSLRPIMDAVGISREKLAFIVDATAAPIASIAPISTWIGFEVNEIEAQLKKIHADFPDAEEAGLTTSGLTLFFRSIPYRFYPIFLLVIELAFILSQRDFGPMLIAERYVRVYGRTDGGDGAATGSKKLYSLNTPSATTPGRAYNMLVPVLLLVFFLLYFMVQTGTSDTKERSFGEKIENGDSYAALVYAGMSTALISAVFYMLQFKKNNEIVAPTAGSFSKCLSSPKEEESEEDAPVPLMNIVESTNAFVGGMTKIFGAIVVLILAWAVAAVMSDIGTPTVFSNIVQENLEPEDLPTISFVMSALLATAIGTSWGTMSIVFPLVMFPAWEVSQSPAIMAGVVAGVLSGAVAGDHVSPISDTSVLSAIAAECDLMKHIYTQAPYVILSVIISIIFGTLPTGRGAYSPGVAIFIGIIAILLSTRLIGTSIMAENGKFDFFTELYMKAYSGSKLHQLKEDTARSFDLGEPLPSKGHSGGPIVADADDDDTLHLKA